MVKRFTAKSVLIFFILGLLCATFAAAGVSLSSHGIANTGVPGGCAQKIPLFPGKKPLHSGVLCTSGHVFHVLSGGFALAQAHEFFKLIHSELGVILLSGLIYIASSKYLFRSSLAYPIPKVRIHLSNLVLTR